MANTGEIKRFALLTILGVLLLDAAAQAGEVAIRILSLLEPQELRLTAASGGIATLSPDSGPVRTRPVKPGDSMRFRLRGGTLRTDPDENVITGARLACPGGCRVDIQVPGQIRRMYHGNLQVTSGHSAISIVLYISQEELVASITESESGGTGAPDALRAFAVTARSFLLAGARHPESGADACDTTHCQVFRGLTPSRAALAAASETSGMVLAYKGRAFRPYYSRSCGGRTARYEDVWGEPSPDYPFPSVDCPCAKTSVEWTRRLPVEQLALATGIALPTIRQNGSWIDVAGAGETRRYTTENFRILLGQTGGREFLPANRFEIRQERDSLVFHGRGAGHGVGLCQDGAAILAARGADYRRILHAYFPGTDLQLQP